jgi:hypothetical protein
MDNGYMYMRRSQNEVKTAKSSWFIELGDSSLSRLRAQGALPGSRFPLVFNKSQDDNHT